MTAFFLGYNIFMKKKTGIKKGTKQIYFVYFLQCADKSIYCGIAKNIEKRTAQHNAGKGSSYVRSRGGGKIVYQETQNSLSLALKRESQLKKLDRPSKLFLIKSFSKSGKKRLPNQRQF